jgi:hypothetical protein
MRTLRLLLFLSPFLLALALVLVMACFPRPAKPPLPPLNHDYAGRTIESIESNPYRITIFFTDGAALRFSSIKYAISVERHGDR